MRMMVAVTIITMLILLAYHSDAKQQNHHSHEQVLSIDLNMQLAAAIDRSRQQKDRAKTFLMLAEACTQITQQAIDEIKGKNMSSSDTRQFARNILAIQTILQRGLKQAEKEGFSELKNLQIQFDQLDQTIQQFLKVVGE